MEERSQGAIEYLMMLAAALVVVAGIVYMLFSTSSGSVNLRLSDL